MMERIKSKYLLLFSLMMVSVTTLGQEGDQPDSTVASLTLAGKYMGMMIRHGNSDYLPMLLDITHSGVFTIYQLKRNKNCKMNYSDVNKKIEGRWELQNDFVVLHPKPEYHMLRKDTIQQQIDSTAQQLTIRLIDEYGKPIPSCQVRLNKAGDFIVLRTDKNGLITVDKDQYESIYLLGFSWYKHDRLNIPIDGGGELIIQTNWQLMTNKEFRFPKEVTLKTRGTIGELAFKDYLQGYEFLKVDERQLGVLLTTIPE